MKVSTLRALSPADGRYADKVNGLRDIFSEYGLIRFRVLVEVSWLHRLADEKQIGELGPLSSVMKDVLNPIVDEFSICLLYTSPSPRDGLLSRMPSSA